MYDDVFAFVSLNIQCIFLDYCETLGPIAQAVHNMIRQIHNANHSVRHRHLPYTALSPYSCTARPQLRSSLARISDEIGCMSDITDTADPPCNRIQIGRAHV